MGINSGKQLYHDRKAKSGCIGLRRTMPSEETQLADFRRPPPWLEVDPKDRLSRLPRALWTRPDQFVPQVDPFLKEMYNWGMPEEEDDGSDDQGMAAMMAKMMSTNLYFNSDSPAVQYKTMLGKLKHARVLKAREAPSYKTLQSAGYVLKVEMHRVFSKSIWRRFRVCGGVTLYSFQDRILQGVMGWCRRYHSYKFTDGRDGATFGPQGGGHIDDMHRSMRHEHFLDDRLYCLADVLTQPGDTMNYLYDLGDQWFHRITLEEIIPDTHHFELLDGAMSCPPEDSNGCDGMGNHSYDKILRRYDVERKKLSADLKRLLRQATTAHNITPNDKGLLDPYRFVIEEHRAKVAEALAEPLTIRGGSGMAEATVHNIGPPRSMRLPGPSGPEEMVMGPTVHRDKDTLWLTAICGGCGSPHSLMVCSRCNDATFCSKECQTGSWRLHKKQCKRL